MILPDFAQTMARYNRWQNGSLIAAAAGLSDAERRRDRGAFFGSIFATLAHLYWADTMWLHRFTGTPAVSCACSCSLSMPCLSSAGMITS